MGCDRFPFPEHMRSPSLKGFFRLATPSLSVHCSMASCEGTFMSMFNMSNIVCIASAAARNPTRLEFQACLPQVIILRFQFAHAPVSPLQPATHGGSRL